jgi:hypothetical protein
MATRAGIGMSHHHSPSVAGREAAEQALENAGLEKPDFVFMFASVGYDQRALLRAVREATGGAPLCGCSGEGTINGEDADESDFSVVVMGVSSEDLRWHNWLATGLSTDSHATGQRVTQSLSPHLGVDAVGLFVFPDGIMVNFAAFLAGLQAHLPADLSLPLWGGAAADNLAMSQTYQYCDDEVVSDGVAYALLSGEAQPASAVSNGYVPIGGERKVTRSKGNVIYEIDGKPAVEVLQEYLPDPALAENWGARLANSFALCFRAPNYIKDEDYIFRAVLSVNKAEGSLTLATEIQEGTSVWFSSRNPEKVTTGLDLMATQIKQQLGDTQPKLVFHFDCTARGKIMFRDQEKLRILRRFRQAVGPDVPWVGFYTYGEIGPVGKHNCHHNYTAVVLALS